MFRAATVSLAVILSLALSSAVLALDTIERYDDGLIKIKYTANAAGQKIGDYLENYPKGKIKLKCFYKADQLHGPWTSYYESGAVHVNTAYAAGQLHGSYVEQDEKGKILKEQAFFNGLLLYPRSQRQIVATLAEIGVKTNEGPVLGEPSGGKRAAVPNTKSSPAAPLATTTGSGGLTDPANIDAIKRLNAYRYLAGVPWDVTLNADYCQLSSSGAKMLAMLGHLDHTPANPGLPPDEYKMAFAGTSHGNLHEGRGTRSSVDGYIFDSDPRNIDRVGHRRWCLDPVMLQTGFGESGKFSVMYAFDMSRRNFPDFDYVAWPCAGYMPVTFFGHNYAWHVSVNPHKYLAPTLDVKAAIYPLLASGPGVPDPAKRGPALALDYLHIDDKPIGQLNNAVIFRPKNLNFNGPQTRYWVEITGLKKKDGSDAKIEYLVDFCSL